ncbi:MAG: hypothetical protein ABH824_03750 [Nanoarchaeota archaeon]|nr:hypothetical protein [Nanoarchaeota archaeon]MBU1631858.1 hypothetical protein [Nanoarchaeota archaeon]MBU1875851.1 hypothetical protein [Nanoarchaeota archaeon]
MGGNLVSLEKTLPADTSLTELVEACDEFKLIKSIHFLISAGISSFDDYEKMKFTPFYSSCICFDNRNVKRLERAPKYISRVPYHVDDINCRIPKRFISRHPSSKLISYGTECVDFLAQNGYNALFRLRFDFYDDFKDVYSSGPNKIKDKKLAEPYILII